MKITNAVILSETKNLMLSMKYETLHFVQGDNFETFARIYYRHYFLKYAITTCYPNPDLEISIMLQTLSRTAVSAVNLFHLSGQARRLSYQYFVFLSLFLGVR